MFVDIPSDKILPDIEKGIIDNMKIMMQHEDKKVVIEKIEWTPEGIRVWIQD